MRELYIEGVAIHDGPESCAGTREGAGEALTGVRAGWAMEPRNHHFGVPTLSHEAEGNIAVSVSASGRRTPRGLRTCACTESSCARTGRSRARPPGLIAGRAVQGTPRR
jgi:RNA-directed DNA polymerase